MKRDSHICLRRHRIGTGLLIVKRQALLCFLVVFQHLLVRFIIVRRSMANEPKNEIDVIDIRESS
jgi:hypothetical protein